MKYLILLSFAFFSINSAFADAGFGGSTPAKLTPECRKQAALFVLNALIVTGDHAFTPDEYVIRFGDRFDGYIDAEIVTTRDFHLGPIWKLKLESAPTGACRVSASEYYGIGS